MVEHIEIIEEENKDIEPKRRRKRAGVRYVGAPAFLVGIPARDMNADEWERIKPETRAHLLKLGLYKEA